MFAGPQCAECMLAQKQPALQAAAAACWHETQAPRRCPTPAHPSSLKFLICAAKRVGNSDASKRSMFCTPLTPSSSLRAHNKHSHVSPPTSQCACCRECAQLQLPSPRYCRWLLLLSDAACAFLDSWQSLLAVRLPQLLCLGSNCTGTAAARPGEQQNRLTSHKTCLDRCQTQSSSQCR